MMKYIGNDYEGCEPYTDELEYGLGSLYPMPGGLRENVEHFLGKEQVVRQVEGEHEAYEYLRSYAKRIQQNKELPFMVDILNCAKGCLYGTATDPKRGTDDVMLTIAKLRNSKTSEKQEKAHFGRKSKSRSPWADTLTPEERLKTSWTLLESWTSTILCAATPIAQYILRNRPNRRRTACLQK